MSTSNMNFCIILAGGKGKRLWPYSTEKEPKQFVDFFGTGKTQLQDTFQRMERIVGRDHILVCTNREYVSLVKNQLQGIDDSHIVIEPVGRNTAPSVALACMRIRKANPTINPNVVVVPSDQLIRDENAFADSIRRGFDFVSNHDQILNLGIMPSRPEPGYGYVQMGDNGECEDVYRVQSFTEKPEREFAQMFMHSGEFCWNTGMYISTVNTFRLSFDQMFPEMCEKLLENCPDRNPVRVLVYVTSIYSSFPNLSIDYGVLECCPNVSVMKCHFGWADLGTWHSVYECMKKGDNDNVTIDSNVMMENCHNNIIKIPKDKLAVINGLNGYIVVERDNVKKKKKKEDSSSLIRKYVNAVSIKYGDEYV